MKTYYFLVAGSSPKSSGSTSKVGHHCAVLEHIRERDCCC